jgi:hypothetical protein
LDVPIVAYLYRLTLYRPFFPTVDAAVIVCKSGKDRLVFWEKRVHHCMLEMVQGLSLSTLATSGKSGVYGSIASWRKHYKLMKKTPITSATVRHSIWPQYVQSLLLIGNPNILRHRNLRVDAGWLFKGGGQGLDASSERSESANEDILIFFFQLDLATRVQV